MNFCSILSILVFAKLLLIMQNLGFEGTFVKYLASMVYFIFLLKSNLKQKKYKYWYFCQICHYLK